MKTVSVSVLHDKFKIIGSIARRLIQHFEAAGKIRKYAQGFATQYHYTGVDVGKEEPKAAAPTKKEQKDQKDKAAK